MIRYCVCLLLSLLACARDNPFLPYDTPRIFIKSGFTPPPLNNCSVSLPADTKKIKSVELTYNRFDGTEGKIAQVIDRDVDWRVPVVIVQKNIDRNHHD